MPIFSFRRDHDGSPEQRVAAIEESLAALIRVHKEEVARLEHRITVLWAMAVPAWIREAIPHAEALGWTIEPQTDCLKFCHLEFDDSWRIPLPLPEDEAALIRIQRELHLRLGFVGPTARQRYE